MWEKQCLPQKSPLCVVSGLLELLHSFLQALPASASTSFSSHDLRCWFSASPHHAIGCKVLPGLGDDVKCFHVSLADILVAQLWAAFGSPSRYQISIENAFWDVAILHAVDMPQPTQPGLSEQGENACKVGSKQDLGICGPRLTAVQHRLETTVPTGWALNTNN